MRCRCKRLEILDVMAVRSVNDDRRARLGVGEGIVVGEVLEACRHRRDRQAVRVEVVGLTRNLEAAQVAESRSLDERSGTRARDDSHVEASVVGDKVVAVGELDEVGQLLAPQQGIDDVNGHDAVDAGVPFREGIVPERRLDQPSCLVYNAAVPYLDEAHRTRARTRGVSGFEVNRGEIQWHALIVSRASDWAGRTLGETSDRSTGWAATS
jgi:hypothetical protein